jgi:hypothetical protein
VYYISKVSSGDEGGELCRSGEGLAHISFKIPDCDKILN